MNSEQFKYDNIYFLGIGGIGMSALARYFNFEGKNVSGYDRTPSPLTNRLIEEGIDIHFTDSVDLIPNDIELIVYTPAIPKTHQEFQFLMKTNTPMLKRSEVLGEISNDYFTIAVAGTHGKTTITSMLAHILNHNKVAVNAFIGGIANNFASNLLLNKGAKVMVVEADEFDRSFLTLHPDIAIISSMDADHLDIYDNKDSLKDSFYEFANNIKAGGTLLLHDSLEAPTDFKENITFYGENNGSLNKLKAVSVEEGKQEFTVSNYNNSFEINMAGRHNLLNATAAISVANMLDVEFIKLRDRISTFKGIYRRFQIHTNTETSVYIDDYAHHPTELKKTIEAVREHFPGRHLTVIFQPHLFSRTKDQEQGFCQELRKVDRLILLPIYAARENAIPGFNTQSLFEKISHPHAKTSTINSIFDILKAHPVDVLLSVGAGDIDLLVPDLKKWTSMDA